MEVVSESKPNFLVNSESPGELEFAFPSPGTDGKEAPEPPAGAKSLELWGHPRATLCWMRIGISWDFMDFFCPIFQVPGGAGAAAWKSGAGKQKEVRMENCGIERMEKGIFDVPGVGLDGI